MAAALSPREADELEAILEATYAGEPLADYITRVNPKLPPPPHILRHLIPKLEEAKRRPLRLIINMPPRHAKSHTVAHFIAWYLDNCPTLRNAYATYSDDLSLDMSKLVRKAYSANGGGFEAGSNAVHDWRTAEGGGMVATTVRGILTGKPVTGVAVVDDPHKDRAEAESGRIRENVWEWFRTVVYSRLEPGASCIVIQTRWHTDDLSGRLLRGETGDDWELVELPAIADEDTDHESALWPEQFPLEQLHKIKKTQGAYNWSALYQQRPRPRGGRVFNSPSRFELENFRFDGLFLRIGVDPAASAKTSADYSVGLLLGTKGVGDDARGYVIDVLRVQEEIPKFCRRLLAWQRRWIGAPLIVEAVAGFKAVPQIIRELAPGVRVVEVKPSLDKFQRAQSVAAAWNDGRIAVPITAPWDVEAFLDEVDNFTGLGDVHDDQVDALAHAWNDGYKPLPPMKKGARVAPFLPFG